MKNKHKTKSVASHAESSAGKTVKASGVSAKRRSSTPKTYGDGILICNDKKEAIVQKLRALSALELRSRELVIGYNAVNRCLSRDHNVVVVICDDRNEAICSYLVSSCLLRKRKVYVMPRTYLDMATALRTKHCFCFAVRDYANDNIRKKEPKSTGESKDSSEHRSSAEGRKKPGSKKESMTRTSATKAESSEVSSSIIAGENDDDDDDDDEGNSGADDVNRDVLLAKLDDLRDCLQSSVQRSLI